MPLMTESELVRYALELLQNNVEPIDVSTCRDTEFPYNDTLSYARWTYHDPTGEGTVTISFLSDEVGAQTEKGLAIMRPTSVTLTHYLDWGRQRYRVKRPLRMSTAIELTNVPPRAAATNIRMAFAHALATA